MSRPPDPPELTWADVWLLHAIGMTAGEAGADLAKVIAAGDFIEHAIFMPAEVRGGVRRLLAAHLIELENGLLRLAPQFRPEYARLSRKRSVRDVQEALRVHLGASAWSGDYDPRAANPGGADAGITDADFEAAVRTYYRWAGMPEES